jgi:Transcriptional regulator
VNIQRLRIFIDLAKTLNYTETAENLYTTQGNISKHILALEKELSVSLFNRSHRKISLTREGEITLEYAKKIISESNELQSKLLAYQDEKNSNIQMYTIPTMPNYKSFALISEFLKSYPQIHIQLREEESQNLFTALNSRQCEMIFARTFTELDDNLEK